MNIGDSVLVPEPNQSDLHSHGFRGTIIDIEDESGLATIEDQEGNIFDVELYRLEETK